MPDYITIEDSPEKPASYSYGPQTSYHHNPASQPSRSSASGKSNSSHRMLEPPVKKPGPGQNPPARPHAYDNAPALSQSFIRPAQAPNAFGQAGISASYQSRQPHAQSHTDRGYESRPQPAMSFNNSYEAYIRPQTAFRDDVKLHGASTFRNALGTDTKLYNPKDYVSGRNGIPAPASSKPEPAQEEDAERFDLNAVRVEAKDYERFQGDSEKHMRELLSGAIGDVDLDIAEGDDEVEGFSDNVRLMPHQVTGVKWMRARESSKGRKYGGILADDMGLGKTVQTLARIVEGKATTAERKAGYTGGTLIVAPLAVMEQWATEVRSKTLPGELKVTTHHGPSRAKTGKLLEKFDVVITTYQTLASEWPDDGKSTKKNKAVSIKAKTKLLSESSDSDSDAPAARRKTRAKGPLFQVKWLRIVLDEAQNIKNDNTKAAKSATALEAKYRWCLTGTPIQNNVLELYSLLRFLRIRPLDDWELFRDRIDKPMKRGEVNLVMKRLHLVLKVIMLRRTKTAEIDGKPILNLPKRTLEIVDCAFEADEQAFYNALAEKTELTFNKFLRAGSAMRNWTHILTMLLRLRQACDHPSLVTEPNPGKNGMDTPDEEQVDELADMLGGLGVEGGIKCDVCFTSIPSGKRCDTCTDMITGGPMHPQSAKIRKLMEVLRGIRTTTDGDRTIVFSQFTSFLDLIEPFLLREGIKFVRYDGSMRNEKRLESLEAIRTGGATVILISFKAGSTGLNLTCCNHVVLMDMWWNPALEDQAFDRAHRLGQTKDVMIYKLRVENTVEDRILELQIKKRELAHAALSGDTKGLMKLSLNDVIDLFRRGDAGGD